MVMTIEFWGQNIILCHFVFFKNIFYDFSLYALVKFFCVIILQILYGVLELMTIYSWEIRNMVLLLDLGMSPRIKLFKALLSLLDLEDYRK